MCSNAVQCLIEDTVKSFVDEKKSFTAYDVTVEARKSTKEIFFHDDVKDLIHSTMKNFTKAYSRRPHPVHSSWEYVPVSKPIGFVVDDSVKSVDVSMPTFTPDNRGRLAIRKRDVSKLNLQPGGVVYIRKFPNSLQVSNAPDIKADAVYTVDKYGNVRISKSLLPQASRYKYNVYSNRIVVVKA